MKVEQLESESNAWTLYLYAMKSPVTREKYQKRLDKFFDFLGLEGGSIEEKSRVFVEMARKDNSNWTFNNILKFIQFQNSRVVRKEISGATVRNYVKSINYFVIWLICLLPGRRLHVDFQEEGDMLMIESQRLKN